MRFPPAPGRCPPALARALMVLALVIPVGRTEEQSVSTALSSTTLSGFIDTSALWGPGFPRGSRLICPGHDEFGNRPALPALPAILEARPDQASARVGDPVISPLGAGRTTWWTWTAPVRGTLMLDAGSGSDTGVAVFRGSSLEELVVVTGPGIRVKWAAEAGTTYAIAVGASDDREGNYFLGLILAHFAPRIVSQESRTVTDGSFRLGLDRLYGRPLKLLFSTDLLTWQPLWNGRFNADDAVVRDFSAGTEPRFYRVEASERFPIWSTRLLNHPQSSLS